MKTLIKRSSDYVKARRIATGENVPEIISAEIAPADLAEETRKIIIESTNSNAYPDELSLHSVRMGEDRYPLEPRFRITAVTPTDLRADVEPEAITPALVDSLIAKAWADYQEDLTRWNQLQAKRADEQAKRREREQNEQERVKALREQREAEQAAREQVKSDYLSRFIADHGTLSQQERHARGLLAQDELLATLRDYLFSPIEAAIPGLQRYNRITTTEVEDSYGEAGYGDEVIFDADPLEALTETEFAILQHAELKAPEAMIEPRLHWGRMRNTTAETDEQHQIERRSLRVTFEPVPGLKLSREYALSLQPQA